MQHDLSLRTASVFPVRVPTLIAALTLSAGLCASPAMAIDRNSEGWTVLEPSVDTRIIFVSSSEGSDHNSGLTPSRAVRTLERAEELVRDGYPDWILLKRGDTWTEGFGSWALSGRSDDERVLISAYGQGDERPKIMPHNTSFIVGRYNTEVNNVSIVGLEIVGDRDAGDSSIGIRWLSNGENFLMEDCLVRGFKDNIVCQASGGLYENIELRRNVIIDSWSTDGHSQGVYVSGGQGVLLEENIIDHNGWNDQIPGAEADTFNQNVYLQTSTHGVTFDGNLTTRAGAAGVQMRTGGVARDNMIYANALGMRFGYHNLDWPTESASGLIAGNVIMGGEMANPDQAGSGIGFWIERADQLSVQNNVVADFGVGTMPIAYTLHGFAGDVQFVGNVAFNNNPEGLAGQAIKSSAEVEQQVLFENNSWYLPATPRMLDLRYQANMSFVNNSIGGISESDRVFYAEGSRYDYPDWLSLGYVTNDNTESALVFPHPGRDLDGYAQSLGYDNAIAFIEAARNMSRANWDARLTGRAAARWIRAGFISAD